MIDYDSFSLCHLMDIFFRYSRGSKRVNGDQTGFKILDLYLFLMVLFAEVVVMMAKIVDLNLKTAHYCILHRFL